LDEPSSVERLWQEFKLKASSDARERLILHYSPLVKYVAGRVSVGLPPNIEQADLVSYGISVSSTPSRNTTSTGASSSRPMRFPASKERSSTSCARSTGSPGRCGSRPARSRRPTRALENRLHRSPTDAEVAQELGISTGELHHIFNQISFVSVVALDELLTVGSERGDRLSLVDTLEDKGAEEMRPSSPAPSTDWPSARRSSSRCTTTRG
jgi:RNA polymerase sigma factor for flagellar operon FliA